MNLTSTSNPAFSESRFARAAREYTGEGQPMTIQGTATKTLLLLGLVLLSGTISWKLFGAESPALAPLMIGGIIGTFICGLVCCFKQDLAHIFGPIYAICEGLTLGAFSAMYNNLYEGIVLQAVMITVLVCAAVTLGYKLGVLKASGTFKKVIAYATVGIAAFYFISLIANMFGAHLSVFSLGIGGIVIQVIIIGVAALNLVLDYDTIENAVETGAPAKFEWYASFGLMVTLIWVYIEVLRLLAALRSRD